MEKLDIGQTIAVLANLGVIARLAFLASVRSWPYSAVSSGNSDSGSVQARIFVQVRGKVGYPVPDVSQHLGERSQ
jgi:hypothetical protein